MQYKCIVIKTKFSIYGNFELKYLGLQKSKIQYPNHEHIILNKQNIYTLKIIKNLDFIDYFFFFNLWRG